MNDAKHAILYKSEIEIAFGYIQAWPQRQCMCLYRDVKNFERFNLLVQSMIYLMIHHLKHSDKLIEDYKKLTINISSNENSNNNNNNNNHNTTSTANHNNNNNNASNNFTDNNNHIKQIKTKSENDNSAKKQNDSSNSNKTKSLSIAKDSDSEQQTQANQSESIQLPETPELESETNASKNVNSTANANFSNDVLEKKEAANVNTTLSPDQQLKQLKKELLNASITPPILKTPTKSVGLLESPTVGNGTGAGSVTGVGVGEESISTSSNYSVSSPSSSSTQSFSLVGGSYTEETWILPEVEKFFLLVSKVFLLNFPLYIAYKHSSHARVDDISAEEAQHLAIFCDLHDNDIPLYLLRNICVFCNTGGFAAMMVTFEHYDLPVSTAHAIVATVSNIKLWLNYGCIVQLFVPLRSRVLQYMCKLSDQNLRTAATRAMADFVWSAIRDPLDGSVSFDVEGLALAFKYFTSTTLTMRLAGKYFIF